MKTRNQSNNEYYINWNSSVKINPTNLKKKDHEKKHVAIFISNSISL